MIRSHERLTTVDTDAKPDIGDIGDYFKSRFSPTFEPRPDAPPLSIAQDDLGNTVYTSNFKTEKIMGGEAQAVLAVSEEGKELVRCNPGLLGRIASGNLEAELIGEGDEGKVYKILLNTAAEQRPYALKYTFPISSGGELGATPIYTPGVDQMRILQLVRSEDPVPGMTYAVPVMATLDMTLAPYMSDATDVWLARPLQGVSVQTEEQFRSIVGSQTLGELSTPFMDAYYRGVSAAKRQLRTWCEEDKSVSFISKRLSFDDSSKVPFLTHIPSLYALFRVYQSDQSLIEADNKEQFDAAVAGCLIATELFSGE